MDTTFTFRDPLKIQTKEDVMGFLKKGMYEQLAEEISMNKSIMADDEEIIGELVKHKESAFDAFIYASKRIQDNTQIASLAIQNSPRNSNVFAFVSDRLKNNKDFAIWAMKYLDYVFRCCPEKLRDDREFALMAIKNTPKEFMYVSDRLKNDKKLALLAVQKDCKLLYYVSKNLKNDKDIALCAVKQNGGLALSLLSEEMKDDIDVIKTAINHINKENGIVLGHASEKLQHNRELVLEAVKNGDSLHNLTKNALKTFIDDKEIVLEAVKRDGYEVQFVSDRLKNDKDVILEVIKKVPYYIDDISYELKNDKEFMLEAIKTNWKTYECLPHKLMVDFDIIMTALKQSNNEVRQYVPVSTLNKLKAYLETKKTNTKSKEEDMQR